MDRLGLVYQLIELDSPARRAGADACEVSDSKDARGRLAAGRAMSPEWVVMGAIEPSQGEAVEAYREAGVPVIEIAPKDFGEALRVYRLLADAAGDLEAFGRIDLEIARPLAALSLEGFGRRRRRVAPIRDLDPLELFGGHSFASSLIEAVGAESLTHGSDSEPRKVPLDRWQAEGVEVAVYFAAPGQPRARSFESDWSERLAAEGIEFHVLEVDVDRLWLTTPEAAARSLAAQVRGEQEDPPKTRSARSLD
jgi:hypothetical protein